MYCTVSATFLSVLALAGIVQAITPSAGCGKPLPPDREPHRSYNGTANGRRFLYYIPINYDENDPLYLGIILAYHEGSKGPEWQANIDRLRDPEFNTNRLVVYPEGTSKLGCEYSNTCDERWWSNDPDMDNVEDDKAFTTAIIEQLEEDYCFDTELRFAIGKGQGGGLIGNTFACDPHMSGLFDAYGVVAGTLYTEADTCEEPYEVSMPCNPAGPVRIIEFHGLQATRAPYEGGPRKGQCLPSVSWWVEQWAVRNGLGTVSETENLTPDTPNTYLKRYGSGDQRALVAHVYSENVGDEWASIFPNWENEGNTAEYNGHRYLHEFFAGYFCKPWPGGCIQ